jgi:putative tryptophan/tyrosine transport system substrate-binding protein
MRRREFIKVLGGAAAAWPLASRAQQESVPVVGVLSSQSQESEAALLAEWRKALNDTGYVGGRNVLFEYRFADGQGDRLPMLAADLVRRQVTVLVANTTPPALAAKAASTTIPIVFVTGVDPVEVGLVASFNRPGANVTGVTFLSNKLVAKRLELLAALILGTAPIGMLAHAVGRCRPCGARIRSSGSSRHYLDNWRWRPHARRRDRPSDAAVRPYH